MILLLHSELAVPLHSAPPPHLQAAMIHRRYERADFTMMPRSTRGRACTSHAPSSSRLEVNKATDPPGWPRPAPPSPPCVPFCSVEGAGVQSSAAAAGGAGESVQHDPGRASAGSRSLRGQLMPSPASRGAEPSFFFFFFKEIRK